MGTYKPTRSYVLKVYVKRIIRWRRNSWPYLTIDSFADFCDVNVTPPKYRGRRPSLEKIGKAKSIFCDSDKLQNFLDSHHEMISPKIIVSGNTDFEFNEKLKNVPKSVKRLYLQNSYISGDDLYRTIPIGIENFRYGVNGNPKHMKKKTNFISRKNAVLFGPFSPTHVEREIVAGLVQTTNLVHVKNNRIDPKELAKIFQEYKFIAAVRGNGIDTHRIWESLYRGCSPIVKTDLWSNFLRKLNLPVEFVENWTTETLENCIRESEKSEFDPKHLEPLWMPFWENLMRRDVEN